MAYLALTAETARSCMDGQLTGRLLWWCYDAAEPAPWGTCNVCLSAVIDNGPTPATRKSDVPRRILDVCLRPRSNIWTYRALFADVNTAIWALSKTLLILCG